MQRSAKRMRMYWHPDGENKICSNQNEILYDMIFNFHKKKTPTKVYLRALFTWFPLAYPNNLSIYSYFAHNNRPLDVRFPVAPFFFSNDFYHIHFYLRVASTFMYIEIWKTFQLEQVVLNWTAKQYACAFIHTIMELITWWSINLNVLCVVIAVGVLCCSWLY